MQSVSESKQELEASIRYAENAISSAKATIESMEFRQEMAKKQYAEQTGREEALQAQVALLEERIADMQSEMNALEERVEYYDKQFKEMTQGVYAPTMPVIPKDVALAIFREGSKLGAGQGLMGLCERYGFECRIHGIDDVEAKGSASS